MQVLVADVAPIYKKKSKASKDNYRPVRILSNKCKIYERCSYDQTQRCFDTILSKYQFGFDKGYDSQQSSCLNSKMEKKIVDKGGIFGSFLTEVWFFIGSFLTRIYYYIIHSFLSKTFDCLSYELLKTQQHAYEYDKRSLLLICNYLSNLKQRVEIFIILGVKSYLKFHKDP